MEEVWRFMEGMDFIRRASLPPEDPQSSDQILHRASQPQGGRGTAAFTTSQGMEAYVVTGDSFAHLSLPALQNSSTVVLGRPPAAGGARILFMMVDVLGPGKLAHPIASFLTRQPVISQQNFDRQTAGLRLTCTQTSRQALVWLTYQQDVDPNELPPSYFVVEAPGHVPTELGRLTPFSPLFRYAGDTDLFHRNFEAKIPWAECDEVRVRASQLSGLEFSQRVLEHKVEAPAPADAAKSSDDKIHLPFAEQMPEDTLRKKYNSLLPEQRNQLSFEEYKEVYAQAYRGAKEKVLGILKDKFVDFLKSEKAAEDMHPRMNFSYTDTHNASATAGINYTFHPSAKAPKSIAERMEENAQAREELEKEGATEYPFYEKVLHGLRFDLDEMRNKRLKKEMEQQAPVGDRENGKHETEHVSGETSEAKAGQSGEEAKLEKGQDEAEGRVRKSGHAGNGEETLEMTTPRKPAYIPRRGFFLAYGFVCALLLLSVLAQNRTHREVPH